MKSIISGNTPFSEIERLKCQEIQEALLCPKSLPPKVNS